MKVRVFAIALICVLLTGCAKADNQPEQPAEMVAAQTEATAMIRPLPETTMEALENSTVHIAFEQGDFYRDDSGNVLLRMKIYSYDQFDMVDISGLKAGDTILVSGEEILVNTVERNDFGSVLVNGGLEEGGLDLATDDSGIYFVHGYSDMKSWHQVGEAEFPVSADFVFTDSSDLDAGAVIYDAEAVMKGEPAAGAGYLPQNTLVRIENGQVMSMERIYTP